MTRGEALECLAICVVCLTATGCGAIGRWRGQKYCAEGDARFDRGQYGAAEDLYRRAVKWDPSLGEAWYRRGVSNAKLGNPGAARINYLQALRADPNLEKAAVAVVELDLSIYLMTPKRSGELYDEAQSLASRLLKRKPDSYEGLRLMALISAASGNDSLAIKYYNKALRTGQATPEVVLDAVRLMFRAGVAAGAFALADDLMDKAPGFGPVYDVLASVYVQNRQIAKAEEILSRKVHSNPGNIEYLIQLAEFYRNTGNTAEEASLLAHVSEASGAAPSVHLLAGDYYTRTGRPDAAINEYRACAAGPTGVSLSACQSRAAIALMGRGRFAESERFAAELRKAQPEEPGAVTLYVAVRLCDVDAHELQELIGDAESFIGRAKGVDTGNVQAQLARAYSVRAEIETGYRQLQGGDNSGARNTAEAMIRDQTAVPEATVILAKARNRLGDTGVARASLSDLIREHPDKMDLHYQLGMVLLGMGDYDGAGRELQRVLDSGDARAAGGLAQSTSMQGRPKEAVRLLEGAVSLHPDSADVRIALSRAYQAERRYADAASVVAPLLRLRSPGCQAYVQFGENKWLAGDRSVASDTLVKAEPVCSASTDSLMDLAGFQALAGHNENAIRSYWSVLNRSPDDEAAMRRVAELELASGTDLLHANSLAERLYRKHPDDPGTIDLLDRMYVKTGDTAKALQLSQQLIKRAPAKAEYRLQYAIALYRSGDRLDSQKELEKLLKDAPSDLRPQVEKTLYAAREARPIEP